MDAMKELIHLITPEKQAVHNQMESLPELRFIRSNRDDFCLWHLGRKDVCRYSRSGLISSAFYVTKCGGKQLGGSWGYTQTDSLPETDSKCPRCFGKE
jgi:hypothetical protein